MFADRLAVTKYPALDLKRKKKKSKVEKYVT